MWSLENEVWSAEGRSVECGESRGSEEKYVWCVNVEVWSVEVEVGSVEGTCVNCRGRSVKFG